MRPTKPKASDCGRSVPTNPLTATQSRAKSLPEPGPPVTFHVELYLEVINNPDKLCPAYAYVGRNDPPDVGRIVAVFNRSLWPTAAALERADHNALRWLAAGAILDRCLTWPTHPILRAVRCYLAQAGLGERWQDYQAGVWAAYALKDHALFASIDRLSPKPEGRLPEKFACFDVEVDSVRLADWRVKRRS